MTNSSSSVVCAGCGQDVLSNETTVHDQHCEHHGGRIEGGWGKCTHEGRCYQPAAESTAA